MSDPIQLISQTDPGAGYRASSDTIDAAIRRVLTSGAYILGAECAAFETEFAAFVGAPAAIVCGSGTDALVLALKALGIGQGDAVATVSHTAVATVAAIELAGAAPVLLDVEPDTYTLDPDELEAILSRRDGPPVRAVIPVHIYGQPASMEAICAVAARYGAAVVEDCAQAHGATYAGRQVGTWGDAAAFSFYPTKNLGALGDGGAVTTARDDVAARVKMLRQYGWREDRISAQAGGNSRLDELQAAILRVKLARLANDNTRRQAIAAAYDQTLEQGGGAPARRADRTHVFHQYVLRRPDRDDLRKQLLAQGVGTAIHYPAPVHLQPAYRGRVALGPKGCRLTERLAAEIVSLPMHPQLADQDVARVCRALTAR